MIYTKEAPTGKYLTQVAAMSADERIFAKKVGSASDTLDLDWREATDEEVAEWEARKAEQAEIAERERAEMEAQAAAAEAERQAREQLRQQEQEEHDAQIIAAQAEEEAEEVEPQNTEIE